MALSTQLSAYQNIYTPLIEQTAGNYNIPPEIFSGLVNQESSFNPNAYGASGEIGLTQIKPSTAAPGANLWNPATNLDQGAGYLAKLFGKFGNWRDALAAYNAGPNNLSGGYDYADAILKALAPSPTTASSTNESLGTMTEPSGSTGAEAPSFLSDPFGYISEKVASYGSNLAWFVLALALIAFGLWATIGGKQSIINLAKKAAL